MLHKYSPSIVYSTRGKHIPVGLTVAADPQGKDCSYNPVAFPPSMEVRRGKCGKCREQFSADPQGKDCSYNPVAFPPSMEVRCGKCGKCREQFSAMPATVSKPNDGEYLSRINIRRC